MTKDRCLFPRGRTELTASVALTALVVLLEKKKLKKYLSDTNVQQIYSEKIRTKSDMIKVC